ncbi:hypothetical protein [Fibrobacter succinogenes]|uniref:hypothetical protein n=1 Tax=Fibrobacter succinogenes TaxID=833 RepID=UPI001564A6C2|nr:hypothetical protein [Fibrobacter succinogenes]
MRNNVWVDILRKIYSEREIPFSSVAQSLRKELEVWSERKGCISVQKVGKGKIFKVVDEKSLEWEINRLAPKNDLENLPARVQNLAKNSNTKAGQTSLDFSYFLCKAVGGDVFVDGVDVSEITKSLGCFALPVGDDSKGIKCNGSLLLVENQQLLDDLRWVPADFKGIILYYAGNLSARLRAWLKKCSFVSVILFPDYDAVGINNYANLVEMLPDARWYWIDDWKNKLIEHGCGELRKKGNQDTLFENLWSRFKEKGFPDEKLESLMTEIRRQGKMLEQEVVLI